MRTQRRKIILASRSTARRQILLEAGLNLDVKFADIDETRLPKEPVSKYSIRIALAKAQKIASGEDNAIVIGVDTVIALGDRIYGKPKNREEASKFLKALSGKWHKVYSGTVIIDTLRNKTFKKVIVSKVKFVKLTEREIDWYISTGEPMHAAGAYAIQGKGMALIESVDGCLSNVIGVSIHFVMGILEQLKVF